MTRAANKNKTRSGATIEEMIVGVTNFGLKMIPIRDNPRPLNRGFDDSLAPSPLLGTDDIIEAPSVAVGAAVAGSSETLGSGRK